MQITLSILRYIPEQDSKPHWENYSVEVDPMDRVLDALISVKRNTDGTLGFRRSCAHGVCGSDAMMINGSNKLACQLLIRDANPDKPIRVEPLRGLPLLRDLILDMEPFFDGYKSVLPYLINDQSSSEGERLQSPEQRERFDDTSKCILCAACTTSCPIYWGSGSYVGPAAIVTAHRFIFDSRDDAGPERLNILAEKSGVFRCKTAFNCTEACPRGIKVTAAIQEVKREILRESN